MRRIAPLFAVLIGFLLSAPSAHADTCEGVTMPPTVDVDGTTLRLNGMGVREATVFNVNVYVAGLYVTETSTNASALMRNDGVKRLVLHFVRDVSRADMEEAITESFGSVAEAQASNIARFAGFLPDEISEGSELTFTFRPAGLEVKVGSRVRGTISGAAFQRAFLRIYLGPNPPNRGLKSGLLGGSCG